MLWVELCPPEDAEVLVLSTCEQTLFKIGPLQVLK